MPYPKVDYHIHSGLSICARDSMTVPAIVRAAEKRGFDSIAITDHVDVPEETARCDLLREEVEKLKPGIRVLVGCEVEAFGEDLPVTEEYASTVDLVLIATNHFHSFPPEAIPEDTPEENARVFLETLDRAASYPWVHTVAHPLILFETRGGFDDLLPVLYEDLRAIFTKAAQHSVAFEISPRAMRAGTPNGVSSFYKICAECGAKLSIGTDAHSLPKVCHLAHVYPVLDRAGLSDSDILLL
jgi:histidinol phosphatase-like PHP family hydrolase